MNILGKGAFGVIITLIILWFFLIKWLKNDVLVFASLRSTNILCICQISVVSNKTNLNFVPLESKIMEQIN